MDSINDLVKLLLPAGVALIGGYFGNIAFYKGVKRRIDKDIERHKVSYAGLFKERIEIYREILKRVNYLHTKVSRFQHTNLMEDAIPIMEEFNDFINYVAINKPFITKSLSEEVKVLTSELQHCFDSFLRYDRIMKMAGSTDKHRTTATEEYLTASEKLSSGSLKLLQEKIIDAMREDLHIK